MALAERRSLLLGLFSLPALLVLSYAVHAHFPCGCWKTPAVARDGQLALQLKGVPAARGQLSPACEAWKDSWQARGYVDASWHYEGGRNFSEQPVRLFGTKSHWLFWLSPGVDACDVGCSTLGPPINEPPDLDAIVHFESHPKEISRTKAPFFVLRNTESPSNFGHQLAASRAVSDGYDAALTFELSANVSILYSTYYTAARLYAPPVSSDEKIKGAVAFISNCDMVTSFRMEALERIRELGIRVDSIGKCGHNKDFSEDDKYGAEGNFDQRYAQKISVARQYMFLCSFENSVWDDYVTEKFFHALEAGAVPVVIGASNVGDFAPSSASFLRIDSPEDVPRVVAVMKAAMENTTLYESMLEWKNREPSPAFRALLDLPAVHSTCRLCINLADRIRRLESAAADPAQTSQCSCRRGESEGDAPTSYVLLVRERGTFRFLPVFVSSESLTVEGLHDAVLTSFRTARRPVTWREHRLRVNGLQEAMSVWTRVSVYRVYPVGRTQREVLFGHASLDSDIEVKSLVTTQPCAPLEVIFV